MKYLIALFLTLYIGHTASAQDEFMPPASFLVFGGGNLSFVESAYLYSPDARPGYQFGVGYRTSEHFYFSGALQYVHVDPVMSYLETDEVPMQYIQLPVMAGYNIVRSKDNKRFMHGHLGGSFTYLLDVGSNDLEIQKENLRQFGFTVKAGVGADIGNFFADLNYNLLLTHLYDTPGYNNKAKLISWELTVGIKLPVKRTTPE